MRGEDPRDTLPMNDDYKVPSRPGPCPGLAPWLGRGRAASGTYTWAMFGVLVV